MVSIEVNLMFACYNRICDLRNAIGALENNVYRMKPSKVRNAVIAKISLYRTMLRDNMLTFHRMMNDY